MGLRQQVKDCFYSVQRGAVRAAIRAPRTGPWQRFTIFSLHSIAAAESDMAVSPPRFREQLTTLRDAGYRCLRLGELLTAACHAQPLAGPAFTLTFDDGYSSVFHEALPILEFLGMPATVFLTVDFLDRRTAPPWRSTDAALVAEYLRFPAEFHPLEWPQACALAHHPLISIGSHSATHPLMAKLDDAQLDRELAGSRHTLQQHLGVPVSVFSYPYGVRRYGAYSERTERFAKAAGYMASFTSEIGRSCVGQGPYLLPRIPLVDQDGPRDVLAKAAGRYDWVALAQAAFQKLFPNPHER